MRSRSLTPLLSLSLLLGAGPSFAEHGGALTPADRERIAKAVAEARSGKKSKPEEKKAEEKKADDKHGEAKEAEAKKEASDAHEDEGHGEPKRGGKEAKEASGKEASAKEASAKEHGKEAGSGAKEAEGSKVAVRAEKRAHGEEPATRRAEPKGSAEPRSAAEPKGAPEPAEDTPAATWQELLQGNLRFISGKPRPREYVKTRKELAKGQHPKAVVLACSDSRVSPELLFDKNLGDIFVVRTAGNIADPVALGSIEYAVEHLGAKLLVVLGHEECGAVAAAAAGKPVGSPNIQAIIDRIAPAISVLGNAGTSPTLRRVRVELNASYSMAQVLKQSAILREKLHAGELGTVTAVYGLESGAITRIDEHAH